MFNRFDGEALVLSLVELPLDPLNAIYRELTIVGGQDDSGAEFVAEVLDVPAMNMAGSSCSGVCIDLVNICVH
jgi:hypothetical protein